MKIDYKDVQKMQDTINELKHITEWQGDMLKKFGDELRYFQRQEGHILYERKLKKYRDEIVELKKKLQSKKPLEKKG